jgi:hypothetical protein
VARASTQEWHCGGGGGGGARAAGAGGGGGARPSAQPNNSRADSRTNDVRSTSVNNVNVGKNVKVNVDVDQRGGWDHPVAGAMVVGGAMAVTAAAVGSMVNAVPTGCVPINDGGMVYQQCGSTWYQPQGAVHGGRSTVLTAIALGHLCRMAWFERDDFARIATSFIEAGPSHGS